jgi:hypothetical protein
MLRKKGKKINTSSQPKEFFLFDALRNKSNFYRFGVRPDGIHEYIDPFLCKFSKRFMGRPSVDVKK